MDGAARRAIHGLKYSHIESLAAAMAARMALLPDRCGFDAAYPVPLHRSRARRRGFNQAALLVDLLGWPQGPGRLERVRKTDTQVGMRLRERRENVRGAFRYTGPSLEGRTVALVDDVVTTGSTANECARVLRDFGASGVHIVAFARANYDPATDRPIDD